MLPNERERKASGWRLAFRALCRGPVEGSAPTCANQGWYHNVKLRVFKHAVEKDLSALLTRCNPRSRQAWWFSCGMAPSCWMYQLQGYGMVAARISLRGWHLWCLRVARSASRTSEESRPLGTLFPPRRAVRATAFRLVSYDDADVLFTEEQLAEMCGACTEPNAPAPLGCPSAATTSIPAERLLRLFLHLGFSDARSSPEVLELRGPGCEFMSQSTNLNSFECTKDMLPQDGDAPDADNLTKYLELTNNGEYCMAYVRTKGPGGSSNCKQYCEDIGSKCVAVWDQIARTSCTLDPVDIFENHGATCDHRAKLSDMLCICDKPSPEDPFPGPPPERVCGGAEPFNEAKGLCKVCLPNAEYSETPVTEQDQRLRSCILDICSLPDTATLDDKKAISENSCEQDPILPPSGRKLCSSGGPLGSMRCASLCPSEPRGLRVTSVLAQVL